MFAFDGTIETPWLADPADDEATLTMSWTGERTVSRLAVDAAGVPAAEPVRARIEASGGVRDVDLDGFGYVEPLSARDGLSITFYRSDLAADEPLGVGEIRVEGLEGSSTAPGGTAAPEPSAGWDPRCGSTARSTAPR
ncbi:hypothetical protein [Blastococcus brunescens]|uniref:Uncharacterized protein n=1 Tax=Blastococcus brunescens TaxID=1564165 RepID=A0ABZ1AW36_9ACTN|nr:hypothetical protein [Blastococcus sp. BMG 8361]WRL61726.1 hypothetical protein U6N30_16445 [Blastococcus sp. BMG 8361]